MKMIIKASILSVLVVCLVQTVEVKTVKGSGQVITKTTLLSDQIEECICSGMFQIFMYYSPNPQVVLEAEDNVLPYIVIKEVNNKLKIFIEPNMLLEPTKPIKVDLFLHNSSLKKIKSKGSVIITADNIKNEHEFSVQTHGSSVCSFKNIAAQHLNLESHGSSVIDANISAARINLTSNGSSSVRLSGKTKEIYTKSHGASIIQALALASTYCDLNAHGNTHLTFNCENIAGHTAGMSTVYLFKKPKGSIKRSGLSNIIYNFEQHG